MSAHVVVPFVQMKHTVDAVSSTHLHGFPFLYDTETGRRPNGLSCHAMRLPRDELGKQLEKDAGTFTVLFGHPLLSRQ